MTTTGLVIAQIVLWLVVLAMLAVVLGLMRQVGTLLERVSPAGISPADAAALKTGDLVEPKSLTALTGEPVTVGGALGARAQFIVFVSPLCDVCKTIMPSVEALASRSAEKVVTTLAVSTQEGGSLSAYKNVSGAAVVDAADLAVTFGAVELPHVVLIREDGRLATSAPARSLADFEDLVQPLKAAAPHPEMHPKQMESLV